MFIELHSRGSGIEGSLRLQGTTVFILLLCVRQLSDTAGNAAPVIGRSLNCHSWPSIVSITRQMHQMGSYTCACGIVQHAIGSMQVVCTGKEERLLDCFFPENFGIDYVNTPPTDYNDYASIVQAPSSAVRAQGQTGTAPPPSNGLEREECSSGDMRRLSVICRRFDIRGAYSCSSSVTDDRRVTENLVLTTLLSILSMFSDKQPRTPSAVMSACFL